ncbi:hypothetical protein C0991_003923 [Blastosporella zonata]|nr:hypothetical protein C0991_003923 [Blastosporella zonata]
MNNVVPPTPVSVARISTREWTLQGILNTSKRFLLVPRVAHQDATNAIARFEENGIPHIIEGLHNAPKWPKEDFTPEWLIAHGPKEISVRNVHNWTDKILPLNDFIEKSRDAPKFADSQGDTFTPCHKDLCASSGQNLMCYTEKDGSSFWFMTKTADAPQASKYFQTLNQELDHETHVITVEQLAKAPFDVYIAEQKLGDLVLVPPRSCHQVVNYGGITIKTSWSRMTLKGLEAAYYHELPIYRRVCRPETYRVKSTIYLSLIKQKEGLAALPSRFNKQRNAVLVDPLQEKLISTTDSLLRLFDSILLEEFPPRELKIPHLTLPPSTHSAPGPGDALSCDFCGADIFQSFFECLSCVSVSERVNGLKVCHGDGFIICAGCYIEGRSCSCGDMHPMQCRPIQELVGVRDKVAELLSRHESVKDIPQLKDTIASGRGTFEAACLLQKMRKNNKASVESC